MGILIDKYTRVIVQGITGRDGAFHTKQMLNYGTNILGGVTPGKGNTKVDNIPVFNTVREAVKELNPNCSVIFVPLKMAADAILEAGSNDIPLIVCITEGIPTIDMINACNYLTCKNIRLIGPNCPGLITPGECKVGIMPANIHKSGNVGVISRSGTLTYEVVYNLTNAGIGQSTCIGIGGDPIIGTGFIDLLELFENDPDTDAIVLIGEIGGNDEEKAAEFIKNNITKPVIAFISGKTAPEGKRMGHAGAIISGNTGTAESKIEAFNNVGVKIADTPVQIIELLKSKI